MTLPMSAERAQRGGTVRGMASSAARVAPLPRPAALDRYEGLWVAIIDDKVVASGKTSHQLALELEKIDDSHRRRAVVEYVQPPADSYVVFAG